MKNVLVLGFFDGVHIGHREVISAAIFYAKYNSANTILLTFKEPPAKFFNRDTEYVMSRESSILEIKKLGIDKIIEQDFSQIATLSADKYLQTICSEYSPIAIFTGFNHTFGYKRSGSPEFLKFNQDKYNYEYHCIQPIIEDEEIVSSTRIKELIRNGNLNKANKLLDNTFTISGIVQKGAQLGRKIGFPTANIVYPNEIVHLPYGVYKVTVGEKCGIMNWGIKPTVNNKKEALAEVHILNFNENLYGQEIEIAIINKIRDEKKFDSIKELKQQIEEDIKTCIEL